LCKGKKKRNTQKEQGKKVTTPPEKKVSLERPNLKRLMRKGPFLSRRRDSNRSEEGVCFCEKKKKEKDAFFSLGRERRKKLKGESFTAGKKKEKFTPGEGRFLSRRGLWALEGERKTAICFFWRGGGRRHPLPP